MPSFRTVGRDPPGASSSQRETLKAPTANPLEPLYSSLRRMYQCGIGDPALSISNNVEVASNIIILRLLLRGFLPREGCLMIRVVVLPSTVAKSDPFVLLLGDCVFVVTDASDLVEASSEQ